jgi:hypothetical protein
LIDRHRPTVAQAHHIIGKLCSRRANDLHPHRDLFERPLVKRVSQQDPSTVCPLKVDLGRHGTLAINPTDPTQYTSTDGDFTLWNISTSPMNWRDDIHSRGSPHPECAQATYPELTKPLDGRLVYKHRV